MTQQKNLELTQLGNVLLEEGALMRISIRNPSGELCLSADAARELAARLVRLAESLDGLSYRVWQQRREAASRRDIDEAT